MKHLLLIPVFALILCGCESNKSKKIVSTNGDIFTVDTILVHGKTHEVIRDGNSNHFGGIMH